MQNYQVYLELPVTGLAQHKKAQTSLDLEQAETMCTY